MSATSLLKTDDGGYLVTANRYLASPGGYVFKFSGQGILEWSSNAGTTCDRAGQTADGGYILAGWSGILKLNRLGQMEWLKSGQDIDLSSVQATADRGFIAIGSMAETDPSGLGHPRCIMKLKDNGDVEWAKKFGGSSGYDRSIRQTPDGGYLAVGNVLNLTGTEGFCWIMKLSPRGDIEWQERLGKITDFYGGGFEQTADGGFVLAGTTSSFGAGLEDVCVIKLFPGGGIEWQKTFGSSRDEWASQIVQTMDGGYVVVGGIDIANSHDCLILKLLQAGEFEWGRTFGAAGFPYPSQEGATDVCESVDGGVTIIGATNNLGVEVNDGRYPPTNVLLIKLSAGGNIDPCGYLVPLAMSIQDSFLVPEPLDYVLEPAGIELKAGDLVTTSRQILISTLCWELNQPPLDIRAEWGINRGVFGKESYISIFWKPNPANAKFQISEYRVYRLDLENEEQEKYQLAGSAPGQAQSFVDRFPDLDKKYYYVVTSVDTSGNESPRSLPVAY